jgi:hypothetical protein
MPPSGATHTITLGDALTIRNADVLRTSLLDGLCADTPIELDCAEDAEADLWFAQLVISFGKAADRQASTVTLSPRLADSLQSIIERGGFSMPFPQESIPV